MEQLTRAQVNQHMEQVLEVRYTDLELEKSICQKLLCWGEAHQDRYVVTFAHTYLGDYYIVQNDTALCATHLVEARDMALQDGYDDLLVRIYSLLAIYYEVIADEQSSLQYYVEGIAASRKVGNVGSEGLILNNIAFNFQRRQDYTLALQYYQESYALLKRSGADYASMLGIVMANLASILILSGQAEQAVPYIRQCEALSRDNELLDTLCSQNWCQYHAAQGNAMQARCWADYILRYEAQLSANTLYAFDIYSALFDSMLLLLDAPYSTRFLTLMEQSCADELLDQKKQAENRHMLYCLTFEQDPAQLREAYKRYCLRTRALSEQSNRVITSGLKAAIQLAQVTKQKEALVAKKSSLTHQVNLDELTRVYTRRYLEQLIEQHTAHPSGNTLGIIMLDVDCLKEYNDTYGHVKGDAALRAVGECLLAHTVPGLSPCRYGGDEFVCFCDNLSDRAVTDYIASVRGDLDARHISHETSRCAKQLTLSIGFSNEPTAAGLTPHDLLMLADKALYQSKINGRNTFSRQRPARPELDG